MSETLHLAARIGIDWADAEHAVALQEAGSSIVEKARLPHTPEALAEWASGLRQRFGGRFVGICLETSHGPLVHALLEYEFDVLYPVNPRALKRFRETFDTGGAKDDPDDAGLLLELLLKHEDRLRRWLPDDSETRALARLAQARRKAVDLRTRLSQQLRAELKGLLPPGPRLGRQRPHPPTRHQLPPQVAHPGRRAAGHASHAAEVLLRAQLPAR